jgi:hypothetical protein
MTPLVQYPDDKIEPTSGELVIEVGLNPLINSSKEGSNILSETFKGPKDLPSNHSFLLVSKASKEIKRKFSKELIYLLTEVHKLNKNFSSEELKNEVSKDKRFIKKAQELLDIFKELK